MERDLRVLRTIDALCSRSHMAFCVQTVFFHSASFQRTECRIIMSVISRLALGWGRTPLLQSKDVGGFTVFGGKSGARSFRRKITKEIPKEELRRGPKLELENALEQGPTSWSKMVRPTVFAFAFSGCSIGACAIWQYENQRNAALRCTKPDWWGSQTRR